MLRTAAIVTLVTIIGCLVLSSSAIGADDQGRYAYQDGFEFLIDGDSATIVAYIGDEKEPTIPESITIDGNPCEVTAIGENAFSECTVTSLWIPDSITDIGSYAFYQCTELTDVRLPESDGFDTIEDSLFFGCESLGKIHIPDNVMTIESNAFYGCPIVSIALPHDIRDVSGYTFSGMKKLVEIDATGSWVYSSVDGILYNRSMSSLIAYPSAKDGTLEIPEGVWQMSAGSYWPVHVDTLIIPASMTTMYLNANTLKTTDEFVVAEGNEQYASVNGILMDDERKEIISFNKNMTGRYVIPDSVERVESSAFTNSMIDSLYIHPGTHLSTAAFRGCIELTEATVPSDSLEWVSLFEGCENLASVEIYDAGPGTVGEGLFEGCTSLTDVTIDGITVLSDFMFYGCTGLESIDIPYGVTEIGYGTFSGCVSLEDVSIPDSVKTIGSDAFAFCVSLKQIDLPDGLGELRGFRYSGIESIVIPEGVTSIRYDCFIGCSSLITITLPSTLEEIKSSMMGDSAFEDCNSLTEIVNGSPLNIRIGSQDHGLIAWHAQSIISPGEPSNIHDIAIGDETWTFALVDGTCTLVGYEGPAGDLVLPDRVTINGTTVDSYSLKYALFTGNPEITSVTIPGSVRTIPTSAFEDCVNLRSVTLMDGVQELMGNVFAGCVSLTDVDLGSLTTLGGNGAFRGCTSLETVTLPGSIEYFSSGDFDGCTSLREIKAEHQYFESVNGAAFHTLGGELWFFPAGVRGHYSVPEGTTMMYGVYGIPNMTSIYIPASVTGHGNGAFLKDCGSLQTIIVAEGNRTYKSVDGMLLSADGKTLIKYPSGRSGVCVIPEGVETISRYAFDNATGLTYVVMPESLRTISDDAFVGCTSLKSVIIPSGVETVGYRAFDTCTGLRAVTVLGDTEFENYLFVDCGGPIKILSSRDPGFIDDPRATLEYLAYDGTVRITMEVGGLEFTEGRFSGSPFYCGALTTDGQAVTGWSPALPPTVPYSASTYHAIMDPQEFTVTFLVDGEVYDEETVAYGSEIPIPEAPSKTGVTFGAWSGLPASMPAHDVTAVAVWMTPTVPDGGSSVVEGDRESVPFIPDGSDEYVVSGTLDGSVAWNVRIPGDSIGDGAVVVTVENAEDPLAYGAYDGIYNMGVTVDGRPLTGVSLEFFIGSFPSEGATGISAVILGSQGAGTSVPVSFRDGGIALTMTEPGIVAVSASYEVDVSPLPESMMIILIVVVVIVVIAVAAVLVVRRKRSSGN